MPSFVDGDHKPGIQNVIIELDLAHVGDMQ